jgi:hypothetical protein
MSNIEGQGWKTVMSKVSTETMDLLVADLLAGRHMVYHHVIRAGITAPEADRAHVMLSKNLISFEYTDEPRRVIKLIYSTGVMQCVYERTGPHPGNLVTATPL